MDLFEKETKSKKVQGEPCTITVHGEPLALRMRPRTLDEFMGQAHILGPGKLLRRAIEADRVSSLILYGPPGSGKNCLAHIISNITKAHFEELNAVISSVADVRKILERARARREKNERTILFIDEIHRFNKAQQDVLMPDVERGNLILIGATTHNPFFSIVSPLLSRSLVVELKPLGVEEISAILKRAISDKERGLGKMPLKADEEALSFIAKSCDGDARRALNALEIGALTSPARICGGASKAGKDGTVHYTLEAAQESLQKKAVVYDKNEDGHYDTISAFIKSMRGSDPDAALYWLAKMLYAGEDPRFISRRIVICAAEDVGNADPQALVVANAALQISEFVGMPEARIPLAQATVYIACAPKSNAAYMGIEKAMSDVENGRTLEVPMHLRDANYPGAKKLGHGEGYKYAHSYKGHYVQQEYIPQKRKYYEPADIGYEKNIREYLTSLKQEKPS